MLVSEAIEAPIQGVSQQPDQSRLPGQCSEQINWDDTVTIGKGLRPPFRLGGSPFSHVDTLVSGSLGVFSEKFTMNGTDYLLLIYKLNSGGWTPKILQLPSTYSEAAFNTASKTINLGTGASAYLDAGTNWAAESFRLISLGDKAYLLNRQKTVTVTALNAASGENVSNCVWVRAGAYSTDYKIELEITPPVGSATTLSVAKTTSASDPNDIKTSTIAEGLAAALETAIAGSAYAGDIEVQRENEVIIVTATNLTDVQSINLFFSCSKEEHLEGFGGKVQRISQLPRIFSEDYRQPAPAIQVVGEDSSLSTPYWVRFQATSPFQASGLAQGVWVETFGEGGQNYIDPATMPFKITESGGTFTFEQESWTAQQVGEATDVLLQIPFAGKKIRDLEFFKNRLVFAHEAGFSASEVGNTLNFFRDTMLTTLDTDPIHVRATSGAETGFQWCVPYGEWMVLFSEERQFAIPDEGILTQGTIRLPMVSEYPTSKFCRPVVSGRFLYAAGNPGATAYGNTLCVYEFQGLTSQNNGEVILEAIEITRHVQTYLHGPLKFAVEPRNGYLFVQDGYPPKSIQWPLSDQSGYGFATFKHLEAGGERVQSSWSKWMVRFPTNTLVLDDERLLCLSFIPDVAGTTTTMSVWYADLAVSNQNLRPTDLFLDGRIDRNSLGVSPTYNAGTNKTTFTLDAEFASGGAYSNPFPLTVVVTGDYTDPTNNVDYPKWTKVPATWVSGKTYTVDGDFTGIATHPGFQARVSYGYPVTGYLKLSRLYARKQDGRPEIRGRTIPKRLKVSVSGSGALACKVTNQFGAASTKVVDKISYPDFGAPANTYVTLDTGTWSFPISGRNDDTTIELYTTEPYNVEIQSMAWEGTVRVPGGR